MHELISCSLTRLNEFYLFHDFLRIIYIIYLRGDLLKLIMVSLDFSELKLEYSFYKSRLFICSFMTSFKAYDLNFVM